MTTSGAPGGGRWPLYLGVGVAVLLLIAGAIYSPLPVANLTVKPEPGCDLSRHSCSARLPGDASLRLSVTPRPIPTSAPLRIELELAGIDPLTIESVEVDFAGESMNMGYNRVRLKPVADGRHAAEGSLPVCITGSMVWVANVLIRTGRRQIAVPFRFETGHAP